MGKRRKVFLRALIGLGLASGIAGQAFAQGAGSANDAGQRDRTPSAGPRHSAHDEGGGWRLGLLRIEPLLELGAGYTDNFDAGDVNRHASAVYRFDPSLTVQSDWSRHALNAAFAAPTTIYDAGWTTTDYTATVNGRFDIDRTLNLTAGVHYNDRAEPVGFADRGVTLDEPERYRESGATVGLSKAFGRLRLATDAAYNALDYGDQHLVGGGVISANARDDVVTTFGGRLDVDLTDKTSVFVAAHVNQRNHDLDPPAVTASRDSKGVEYLAGVHFKSSAIWQGDVGAGVFNQSYDDPAIKDQSGFAAHANVQWSPDALVTVLLGAERSIQESNNVDAATVVGDDANLTVDYQMRRNISVSAAAGYSRDAYVETDRRDTRWDASASMGYQMNTSVALTLTVSHNQQDSQGTLAGRSYDANLAVVGVSLRR